MNMESVIEDQKISRRRKPVRILRKSNGKGFLFDRFNPVLEVSGLSDQIVTRIRRERATQENLAGRSLPDPRPEELSTPSRPTTAPRILARPGLRLTVLVILGCSILALLGIATLQSHEQAIDLSGFDLPPGDDMTLLLLHTVIEGSTLEEELIGTPPLPLTLSIRNYTIARNDTLDAIARRFNISLDTLISVNGIADVRRLQVGTVLKIPNIDGIVYKVQKGDNLSTIAGRNNSTLLDLVDANDLASHTISPGQILFIPGARLSSYELKKALGTLVIWPVSGRISSTFGYRSNPFTGIRQFHNGLDIVAPQNTPIKAAMDGRVAETGYSAIFGNFVIMTHAGSYQTLYAHLNRIDVRAGQVVNQGSSVGLLGSTGYSTGPHLHFGVFKGGAPMDPLRLLRGS